MTSQTDELKPCPHVFTSKGGTSHCTLAESDGQQIAALKSQIDYLDGECDSLKRQVEMLREGLRGCKNVGQRIMATEMDRLPQYRCDGNVSRVHELHYIVDEALSALPQQPSLPQGMTEDEAVRLADEALPDNWDSFGSTEVCRMVYRALSVLPGNSVKGGVEE